jgi:antitoxin HicB
MTNKNLEHYLRLPYTTVLRRDDEGDVVARVAELEGCSAHGKTNSEALENIEEAKRLWIEDALEGGEKVPEPLPAVDGLPSGKWLQRVPRSLHKKLVACAQREGVSLNQFVTSVLAEAVGIQETADRESELVHRLLNNYLRGPNQLSGAAVSAGYCSFLKNPFHDMWVDLQAESAVCLTISPRAKGWRPETGLFIEHFAGLLPDHVKTTPEAVERNAKDAEKASFAD